MQPHMRSNPSRDALLSRGAHPWRTIRAMPDLIDVDCIRDAFPLVHTLAQRIMSMNGQTYSHALSHLAAMVPHLDEHTQLMSRQCLQQIQDHMACHYGGSVQHQPDVCETRSDLAFVNWNVRGLRSSMHALMHVISDYSPLAMVLTETHTQPNQHGQPWLDCLRNEYDVHMTSCPTVNPFSAAVRRRNGLIQISSKAHAGVLIAVKKVFAHQYVKQHSCPASLRGHLLHISLHAPASQALHIVGVYLPPMSNHDWQALQQAAFDYIQSVVDSLQGGDARLLVGGDFNASMHDADRSHGRALATDSAFRGHMRRCSLKNALPPVPGQPMPHSFAAYANGHAVHSRIDHWICSANYPCSSDETQPSPCLHSDLIESCSDHLPIVLTTPRRLLFRAMPTLQNTPPAQQLHTHQHGVITAFPPACIASWQHAFMNANCSTLAQLTLDLETANALQHVPSARFDDLQGRIDAMLSNAMDLAVDHFPCKPVLKPVLKGAAQDGMHMPRVLARQLKHHIGQAKACRLARVTALQLHGADADVAAFKLHSCYHTFMDTHPDLCIPSSSSSSLPRLAAFLMQRQIIANDKATAIKKKFQANCKSRQASKWQKLWYNRRKAAYAQVFRQDHDSRGDRPIDIPAVFLPVCSTTAQPSLALEGLHFFHAYQASPHPRATAASAFPWASGVDAFNLQQRGDGHPLLPHLTQQLYYTCLKQLRNGRAPGPNGFPNELLKHLPAAMHTVLYRFFRLCWQAARTPVHWKSSTTKLFYKKGDATDPANYRPIALLNTVYKLWTKLITHLVSDYAERHGILSEAQEGFRPYRDPARQLQYLKLLFDDARMHKRDMFFCMLDFKSAFDTIDQECLFQVMHALNFPNDAIQVIRSLHVDAFTRVSCNFGMTQPISLRRGTIQGDSLSPLLFIIFLEPLLRWLHVNDRGYRCMSTPHHSPHYANALAVADDLSLVSGDVSQLQAQIDKVQSFASWATMHLTPGKCIASGILWAANAAKAAPSATHWPSLQPLLSSLNIEGCPMQVIQPSEPFKYLGPQLTMTSDSKPHLNDLLQAIQGRGLAITRSHGTIAQKLEMERFSILGMIIYHLSVAPFSMAQLADIERARARIIKSILRISNNSASDLVCTERAHFGYGVQALAPRYAQVCAQRLTNALNDSGRLGVLARAVTAAAMERHHAHDLNHPKPGWTSLNTHMPLRQAAIANKMDLRLRFDKRSSWAAACLDLYHLATASIAAKQLSITPVELLEHVLCPLWRAGIYTTSSLVTPTGSMLPSSRLHAAIQGGAELDDRTLKAYKLLQHICCSSFFSLTWLGMTTDSIPEPESYTLHTSPALDEQSLDSAVLAQLPTFPLHLEISEISNPASPAAIQADLLLVTWCDSHCLPTSAVGRLQRCGFRYTLQASGRCKWDACLLPRAIIQHYWPSKVAAFEARLFSIMQSVQQTRSPSDSHSHQSRPDAISQLVRHRQTISQALTAVPCVPPYPSRDHISIEFTDVNPDSDIQPTGTYCLASASAEVACYDPQGSYKGSVARNSFIQLLDMYRPDADPSLTFQAAVTELVSRASRTCKAASNTPSTTIQGLFMPPDTLISALHSCFHFDVQWFSQALRRHPLIPGFATAHQEDVVFGSLGDAYTYKWTHSGLITPDFSATAITKALKWAVRSSYESHPTCNVLMIPTPRKSSSLHGLLQHPSVQLLTAIPARQLQYDLSAMQRETMLHCMDVQSLDNLLTQPAMSIIVVANNAGLQQYSSSQRAHLRPLRKALRDLHIQGSSINALRAVPDHLPPLQTPFAYEVQTLPAGQHLLHIHHQSCTMPQQSYKRAVYASILPQLPTLKYDPAAIVYTDGSKQGTSLTAAWTTLTGAHQASFALPPESSPQRTVLRAELAAIHDVLHSPQFHHDDPIHIMSDSLTSLQLISAHLNRPHTLMYNKHRWLVAAIAQNLLARSGPVRLTKVRSHTGIVGNTLADDLARQAHSQDGIPLFSFSDPSARGPAWTMVPFGDTHSDADTLGHHILQPANRAHASHTWDAAQLPSKKTLQKIHNLESRQSGVHALSSHAYWTARTVPDYERSMVLQVRAGTFFTTALLAKWKPHEAIDVTCRLCGRAPDTIGHRLGGCSSRHIKSLVIARHGHAVHTIATAIKQGALGNCYMLQDAECHERFVSFPSRILPIHLQCSRPDIAIVEGLDAALSLHCLNIRDPRVTLHLVEVGFATDMDVHEKVAVKRLQHTQLCQNLNAYGWHSVALHVFVIGHTGVMRGYNADILHRLGVPTRQLDGILSNLAISSLRLSCHILRVYTKALKAIITPGDAQATPGLPPADAGDAEGGHQASSSASHMDTSHATPGLPPADAGDAAGGNPVDHSTFAAVDEVHQAGSHPIGSGLSIGPPTYTNARIGHHSLSQPEVPAVHIQLPMSSPARSGEACSHMHGICPEILPLAMVSNPPCTLQPALGAALHSLRHPCTIVDSAVVPTINLLTPQRRSDHPPPSLHHDAHHRPPLLPPSPTSQAHASHLTLPKPAPPQTSASFRSNGPYTPSPTMLTRLRKRPRPPPHTSAAAHPSSHIADRARPYKAQCTRLAAPKPPPSPSLRRSLRIQRRKTACTLHGHQQPASHDAYLLGPLSPQSLPSAPSALPRARPIGSARLTFDPGG